MTALDAEDALADPPPYELGGNVILCADDFGMTEGVSRGIEELALARRLSATSAMMNLPEAMALVARLGRLRSFLAAGLHINLTLGAPMARSPGLAPDGELPDHVTLLRRCVAGKISIDEIAAEISRQIDAFEQAAGFEPEIIDGHQHVHVYPRVRSALLQAIAARFRDRRPLIRDPADCASSILRRRNAVAKALALHALAHGFGRRVRAAGFPTNLGFAGASSFDLDVPFEHELAAFLTARGRRHLVMCHPGYPDAALAELDPVVERRHHELDALFAAPRLDEAIWHVPSRSDRGPIDWERVLPA